MATEPSRAAGRRHRVPTKTRRKEAGQPWARRTERRRPSQTKLSGDVSRSTRMARAASADIAAAAAWRMRVERLFSSGRTAKTGDFDLAHRSMRCVMCSKKPCEADRVTGLKALAGPGERAPRRSSTRVRAGSHVPTGNIGAAPSRARSPALQALAGTRNQLNTSTSRREIGGRSRDAGIVQSGRAMHDQQPRRILRVGGLATR